MSITDELREWGKTLTHWWYDPVKDEYTYTTGIMPPSIDAIRLDSSIIAIADRIDAEHEAKVSYWQGASYKDGYDEGFASADDWLGQHEDAMAEHGWIRLPKDADGEYIRVGDMMDTEHFGTVEVEGFVHRAVAFYNYSEQPAYLCTTPANLCRHYHAPTVEDVLRGFTDAILEWSGKSGTVAEVGTWSDVASEYATKLRLAEGEDA